MRITAAIAITAAAVAATLPLFSEAKLGNGTTIDGSGSGFGSGSGLNPKTTDQPSFEPTGEPSFDPTDEPSFEGTDPNDGFGSGSGSGSSYDPNDGFGSGSGSGSSYDPYDGFGSGSGSSYDPNDGFGSGSGSSCETCHFQCMNLHRLKSRHCHRKCEKFECDNDGSGSGFGSGSGSFCDGGRLMPCNTVCEDHINEFYCHYDIPEIDYQGEKRKGRHGKRNPFEENLPVEFYSCGCPDMDLPWEDEDQDEDDQPVGGNDPLLFLLSIHHKIPQDICPEMNEVINVIEDFFCDFGGDSGVEYEEGDEYEGHEGGEYEYEGRNGDEYEYKGNGTKGDEYEYEGNRTGGDEYEYEGNRTGGDEYEYEGNRTGGDEYEYEGNKTGDTTGRNMTTVTRRLRAKHRGHHRHHPGAFDPWFAFNGGDIESLMPLMCGIGYECVNDYINAASELINDDYMREQVGIMVRDKFAPFFKMYCQELPEFDDPVDTADDDITVNIGGETIPLNELRGDKLKDLLDHIDQDELESLIGLTKINIKIDMESKTKIVVKILNKGIVPSVKDWTRDTIQMVEGVLTGLNATLLGEMPSDLISANLDVFGKAGWDHFQQHKLAGKCKDAFGDLKDMPVDIIDQMNALLPGFTPNDLMEVPKTKLVVTIKVFGMQESWLLDQARELINILKRDGNRRLRALTASSFGSDVSKWTNKEVSDCGSLLKGLKPADVQNMTLSQVLSFSHLAFAQFSPELNKIIASKISTMNSEQIDSFTDAQVNAMDNVVSAAFVANGGKKKDGEDDTNLGLYIGVGVGVALVALAVVLKKRSSTSLSRQGSLHSSSDPASSIAYGGKQANAADPRNNNYL
jgi:hypothetical protein